MNVLNNITGSYRKSVLVAALVLVFGFGSTGLANAQAVKPNLYMVSAGISQYTDIAPLKCAHKDAQDVSAFFNAQQGQLFNKVEVTPFINNQATVANLKNALANLQHRATNDDYVIVYLAGHGGKGGHAEYAYCAYDHDLTWSQIQLALRGVSGKVIVILDTCEAGSATGGGNLVVFCGSQATQSGGEDDDANGNGHFTKTFLEALRGRADANGDGVVTLEEVEQYVALRLNQVSGGKQSALVLRPITLTTTLPLVQVAPAVATVPLNTGNDNAIVPITYTYPQYQSSGPIGN